MKHKSILFCLMAVLSLKITKAQPINKEQKDGIVGKLSSPALNEVSGVALSRQHKNIFYVHNDSGDSSRFFAIDNSGNLKSTYYFNATVLDCEDIAVGPGPIKGQSYIYLADIGDNLGWRPYINIYRFKEPAINKERDNVLPAILKLTYPDGPHDAETLMIDGKQKIIYIITKREDSVGIYTCPLNFTTGDKVTLKFCGKIFLDGANKKKWIVSGDITADGNAVIIKSLERVFYWQRKGNEPIYETLHRPATIQNNFTPHDQQEAITFSADGKGYYVLSEGKGTNIYYYKIEK